jgi:hypothetical protein
MARQKRSPSLTRPIYPTSERRGFNDPTYDQDFLPPQSWPTKPDASEYEAPAWRPLTIEQLDELEIDEILAHFREMPESLLIDFISDLPVRSPWIVGRSATMELLYRFRDPVRRERNKKGG